MKYLTPITFVATALVACAPPPDAERVGAARQALEICPGKETLTGIDVSHYDGDVDWNKVKVSGRAFAIAKATEGNTFADPEFATNWTGIKAAGMARGAYHYFHPSDDPVTQADWFTKTMGPLEPGDLPPALDLEVSDGVSADKVTSATIAWLDRVALATHQKPLVYTSTRFVNESMGGDPVGLEDHATLWVSKWDVMCPDVPTPFTGFAIWQTGSGTVPGETAEAADVDVFNGSAADLAKFVVQPPKSDGGGGSGGSSKSSGATGGGDTHPSSSSGGGTGGDGDTTASSTSPHASSGCAFSSANETTTALAPMALALALISARRRRRS
jgi:lysozyme